MDQPLYYKTIRAMSIAVIFNLISLIVMLVGWTPYLFVITIPFLVFGIYIWMIDFIDARKYYRWSNKLKEEKLEEESITNG